MAAVARASVGSRCTWWGALLWFVSPEKLSGPFCLDDLGGGPWPALLALARCHIWSKERSVDLASYLCVPEPYVERYSGDGRAVFRT